MRLVAREPESLDGWAKNVKPDTVLNSDAALLDAQPLLTAMLELKATGKTISSNNALTLLDARRSDGEKSLEKADAGATGTSRGLFERRAEIR